MESHCNIKTYFMKDPSKYRILETFLSDPKTFIYTNFDSEPLASKLHAMLGISDKTFNSYIYEFGLQDLVINDMISMEDEVYQYLTELGISKISQHEQKAAKQCELDLYLPEYKIAFDCNDTATHNSTVGLYNKEDIKEANYHQVQTEECEDAGIFLYHIFSYDWYNDRDRVLSDIRRFLNKNKVIEAKDCKIVIFKNLGSFTVSLIYESATVLSVKFAYRGDFSYEMKDIQLKDGVIVIDGYSTIFNYFVEGYFPKSIIAYNDRASTPNSMYEDLKFRKQYKIDPDFKWVDIKHDIAYPKWAVSTMNVQKFLKDRRIDLSKQLSTIMYEHGYVKVFNSGRNFWKWTLNDN